MLVTVWSQGCLPTSTAFAETNDRGVTDAAPVRDGAAEATSVPSRWHSALVGYVTAVRPTNQRVLGSARSNFAYYLVAMHKKLHPLFAEGFVSELGRLPASDPLNGPGLVSRVEIVLAGDTGNILKMGVVRSSGIVGFDVGALESIERAAPFGRAPDNIRSSDGNVYFSWEFHRDPVYACSTINARPYMLDMTH
jgi:hypothetical protein